MSDKDKNNGPIIKGDIEWIVTPGLTDILNDFIKLCDLTIVPTSLKMNKKKPLLIYGDTGVGKSLFVKVFEEKFKDKNGKNSPVKRINIAALSEYLIESELFGHIKGAFTGADKDRAGLIKTTNEGLLIIEEIGELPKPLQAKFLTFIEYGLFYPVGRDEPYYASVQIIATTNKPKSEFRLDFWYRFFPFYIPAIYQRRGDILYYLYNLHQDIIMSFSPIEILFLLTYNWPGNVREVDNFGFLIKFKEEIRLNLKPPLKREEPKGKLIIGQVFDPKRNYLPFGRGLLNYLRLEILSIKIDPECEVFDSFMERIGFKNSDYTYAFPENTIIDIQKDEHLGLSILLHNPSFEKYTKALKYFEFMFLLPRNLNDNLLAIDEIDSIDFWSYEWGNIFESLKLYKGWTQKERQLQKEIYDYRISKIEESSEFDISSMTEKEIMKKLYTDRIESCGSINKAAVSLGIPKQTFRDRIHREYSELLDLVPRKNKK